MEILLLASGAYFAYQHKYKDALTPRSSRIAATQGEDEYDE